MALTKLLTDLIDGSLGTDWQSSVKTADFTAVAGQGYFVDTTSAGITVTLPSSPSIGNEVTIVDYSGTADTNNITITSSDNINGSSNDVAITYERGSASIVYTDATQGWVAYNATNETSTALVDNPPLPDLTYLLVAGGGGGGNNDGGGGGAGGLLESSIQSVASSTIINITVGSGGSGAQVGTYLSSDGNDSTISSSAFSTITAYGGGRGQTHLSNILDSAGGSGGGAFQGNATTRATGVAGQGNNGGLGAGAPAYAGAGGGGAGGIGGDATGTVAGSGGVGATTTIISTTNAILSSVGEVVGSSLYFAGGGGAGEEGIAGNAYGTGGNGGGGNGDSTVDAEHGTPNTGGGGGGGGYTTAHVNGGNGGSGVCILKIPTSKYSGTTTGSPDVYTEANATILVYKQNGSYTTQ